MSWTGSSPLTAVRAGMWGLLLIAAVSWLAIGWSVLRLEPSNLAVVAGWVILFGALTEVLRACAGTRTWWLNAGMAVLFAATSMLLLTGQETSHTAPAALIGWYLMVRGTVDIAVAVMTRDSDRVRGLLMVVGVLEAGLGFLAASPLSRTADLVVTIVGALGLLRGVADLVTALRIREVRAARGKAPKVPADRTPGLAGYTAGLTDYESVPARGRPRHRAATSPVLATLPDRVVVSDRGALSRVRFGSARWPAPARAGSLPEPVPESVPESVPGPESESVPSSGTAPGSGPVSRIGSLLGIGSRSGAGPVPGIGSAPATGSGQEIKFGTGPNESMWPGGPAATLAAAAGGGTTADVVAGGISATGGMAAAGYVAAGAPDQPADSFHVEVLRTTADLDAILALAGVTGAGVGARLGAYPDGFVFPEVPDTPEGVESPARPAEPAGAWRDAEDADGRVADSSFIAGVRRSV